MNNYPLLDSQPRRQGSVLTYYESGKVGFKVDLDLRSIKARFMYPNNLILSSNQSEPMQGSIVFNKDKNTIEYYDGTQWLVLQTDLMSIGDGVPLVTPTLQEIRSVRSANNKLSVVAVDTDASGTADTVVWDINESNINRNDFAGVLDVDNGGTGLASITANRMLYGDGTNDMIVTNMTASNNGLFTDLSNIGALTVQSAANFQNNVTIQGNLVVNGTSTKINTQDLEVEDSVIFLNKNGLNTDSGVIIERAVGNDFYFGYDQANSLFVFKETTTENSDPATNVYLDMKAKGLTLTDGSEGVVTSDANGLLDFQSELEVAKGGTGLSSVTANRLIKGDGTNPMIVTGVEVDGSNNMSGVNTLTTNAELILPEYNTLQLYVDRLYTGTLENGQMNTPFKTIQAALNSLTVPVNVADAERQFVINVAGGTYTENLVVPNSRLIKLYAPQGGVMIDGSVTWTLDDSDDQPGVTPTLAITGQSLAETSTDDFFKQGGAWIITGNVVLNNVDLNPATSNLYVQNTDIQGTVSTVGAINDINLYIDRTSVGQINSTGINLRIAQESDLVATSIIKTFGRAFKTSFDGLSINQGVDGFGVAINCQFEGVLTDYSSGIVATIQVNDVTSELSDFTFPRTSTNGNLTFTNINRSINGIESLTSTEVDQLLNIINGASNVTFGSTTLTDDLRLPLSNVTQIYVDGQYAGTTANGLINTPYKTINAALSSAVITTPPVDDVDARQQFVINVRGGMYDEDITVPNSRMIKLVARDGLVVLGDGVGANYASTTPRNVVWEHNADEDQAPRSTLTITGQSKTETSSSHLVNGGGAWLISGDIQIDNVVVNTGTNELHLENVKLVGLLRDDLSTNPLGQLNVTMKNCFFDSSTTIPLTTANFNVIERCEFDGSFNVNRIGRIFMSELSGFTIQGINNYIPPASGYILDCQLNGVIGDYTSPNVVTVHVNEATSRLSAFTIEDSTPAGGTLTFVNISYFPSELKNLDNTEIQQLQNIGVSTINSVQWAYLGAQDQGTSTTNDVTFNSLTLTNNAAPGGQTRSLTIDDDGVVDTTQLGGITSTSASLTVTNGGDPYTTTNIEVVDSAIDINSTSGTLNVSKGGTGLTTVTANSLLKGDTTNPMVVTGVTVDGSNNIRTVDNSGLEFGDADHHIKGNSTTGIISVQADTSVDMTNTADDGLFTHNINGKYNGQTIPYTGSFVTASTGTLDLSINPGQINSVFVDEPTNGNVTLTLNANVPTNTTTVIKVIRGSDLAGNRYTGTINVQGGIGSNSIDFLFNDAGTSVTPVPINDPTMVKSFVLLNDGNAKILFPEN